MSDPDVIAGLLLTVIERGPALTLLQSQGNACVWCPRALHTGDAVNLGGDPYWCPRACKACHATHTQAMATYADWNDHLLLCPECREDKPCPFPSPLRAAHVEARRRAGRPSVWCMRCLSTMTPAEAWQPHLWQSVRGPELSYVHTGTCPR
ncbi:hypothetical protein RB200_17280 [Streptomyces sp. PmtG]